MSILNILTIVGAAIVIIAITLLGRFLRLSLGKKMIAATQKDKPKSALQKFFGW